jgi:metal-dependent amidase/aminoacylase/carboxypeptidase family protein
LPFRWSEDFGHFTHNFKGALFGLGSGTNQPELHHPAYNFPDKIILNGTKIFHQIIKQLNG